VRIVCVSDTHMHKFEPPEGDVLIHAGDHTFRGTQIELEEVKEHLDSIKDRYKHIILIAGNHDWLFKRDEQTARDIFKDYIYLQDSSVIIEGVKIYGSPWQPRFGWWAFNLERGQDIKAKWDMIPEDTDILVTHGPPYGKGDKVYRGVIHDEMMDQQLSEYERVGCKDLKQAVERIKPKYHIFGHIHSGYGTYKNEDTTFINASIVNERYENVNTPIVFDI